MQISLLLLTHKKIIHIQIFDTLNFNVQTYYIIHGMVWDWTGWYRIRILSFDSLQTNQNMKILKLSIILDQCSSRYLTPYTLMYVLYYNLLHSMGQDWMIQDQDFGFWLPLNQTKYENVAIANHCR